MEAFSATSSSNTESLRNPDYRNNNLYHQEGGGYHHPTPPPTPTPTSPPAPLLTPGHGSCSGSNITLDGETKCDLHIYHILSCPECRERVKKLLADPVQQPQSQSQQSVKSMVTEGFGAGLNSLINMIGGGSAEDFIGRQINEKLDKLLSHRLGLGASDGGKSKGFESLIMYVLLGILLIFVLDMIMRA